MTEVVEKKPEEPIGNPPEQATPSPEILKQLETANKKVEELTRQYTGSSKEALRLKEELEEVKEKLSQIESSPSHATDDADFNRRVEAVGLGQAIKELVSGIVKPIQQKTEDLAKKEAEELYDAFKTKHPGLNGELLAKFDKEFARLKKVYESPSEALEAAYLIVGGREADEVIARQKKEKEDAQNTDSQSEEDKKLAAQNAGTGSEDRRSQPKNPKADIQAQIQKLTGQAISLEANGRDAKDLWVQIENMKTQLAIRSV